MFFTHTLPYPSVLVKDDSHFNHILSEGSRIVKGLAGQRKICFPPLHFNPPSPPQFLHEAAASQRSVSGFNRTTGGSWKDSLLLSKKEVGRL